MRRRRTSSRRLLAGLPYPELALGRVLSLLDARAAFQAAVERAKAAESALEQRLATRGMPTAGRNAPHGAFTDQERLQLSLIAERLIPTQDGVRGASHPDVLQSLEARVTGTAHEFALYRKGLANLDALALRRTGRTFVTMTDEQQVELLTELDRVAWPARGGLLQKAIRRPTRLLVLARRPAVQLFAVMVGHVLDAYYTHPVSWQALAYDGPPMPLGYLDVLEARR